MQIIDCKQGTWEWFDAKRAVPSSSYASEIVTPVKGEISKSCPKVAYELLSQLVDPCYGMVDEYASLAMRNGIEREPESRKFYEMERNCDVTEVGFVMSDCGRFGASPDSLVSDDGLLELKNPSYKVQIEYLHKGVVPPDYLPQIHWQLLVTRRKWVDFLSYCPRLDPLLIRVEPNDYTVKVAQAMEAFWKIYCDVREKIRLGVVNPAVVTEPYHSPF
jgi:hypothetical protein